MWQLQDAKSKFSRVVDLARSTPQVISKHGVAAVVVISVEEYQRLTTPKRSLYDVLSSAPKADLEVTRQADIVRSCEL